MPLVSAPSTPLAIGGDSTPAPEKPPVTPPKVPEVRGEFSNFVTNHQMIIDYLEEKGQRGSCPSREDLNNLGIDKEEMDAHIAILIMDRYVAPSEDRYCNMDAIMKLKEALKRYRE